MLCFRKASIPLTTSQFRIDQPNAIPFTISTPSHFGPNQSSREKVTARTALPPDSPENEASLSSTEGAPTRNLAILTPKMKRKTSSFQLWLSKVILFIQICLLVHPYLVRFAQCDWHHAPFSHIIQFGYGRTSLNAGAVVVPQLTMPSIDSVPPSAVLSYGTRTCWSFRGKSGTFGIALDTPNVIPTHVGIHHWLNSTTQFSRAPRDITVWGLVDGEANLKTFSQSHQLTSASTRMPRSLISKAGPFLPLGEIYFNISAGSQRGQVFPLYSEALSLGMDFGVIVFDIRSNWGEDITSLCSIHVYGHTVLVD